MVLETKNLKSVLVGKIQGVIRSTLPLRALRKNSFFVSFSFCLVFASIPRFVAPSLVSQFFSILTSPVSSGKYPSVTLRTLLMTFRIVTHPECPG